MDTLPGEVGNWVSGERFWGRQQELAQLLEYIEEGANISIMAPRRIGKTSLMREAAERLPPEYISLHIDVQDARDMADLVVKLAAATRGYAPVWSRITECFGNALRTVKDNIESISAYDLEIQLRAGLSGDAWQEKGSRTLAELACSGRPVTLFIDEFPLLVDRLLQRNASASESIQAVHTLLCWLRGQAQTHQGRIRMVFAGSIGLEPVLHRVGLSGDINHLRPFCLDPWADPVAQGCLHALAAHKSMTLPEESARRMLELLGCNIPYHVQMFFSHVREYCRYENKNTVSCEDVDAVFQNRMLGTKGHVELAHMENRLEKVLEGTELCLAKELLSQTAVSGGIGRSEIRALATRNGLAPQECAAVLPRLFEIFEHDGYLRPLGDGRYEFVSNLLRQWWKARSEAFFEPLGSAA